MPDRTPENGGLAARRTLAEEVADRALRNLYAQAPLPPAASGPSERLLKRITPSMGNGRCTRLGRAALIAYALLASAASVGVLRMVDLVPLAAYTRTLAGAWIVLLLASPLLALWEPRTAAGGGPVNR